MSREKVNLPQRCSRSDSVVVLWAWPARKVDSFSVVGKDARKLSIVALIRNSSNRPDPTKFTKCTDLDWSTDSRGQLVNCSICCQERYTIWYCPVSSGNWPKLTFTINFLRIFKFFPQLVFSFLLLVVLHFYLLLTISSEPTTFDMTRRGSAQSGDRSVLYLACWCTAARVGMWEASLSVGNRRSRLNRIKS